MDYLYIAPFPPGRFHPATGIRKKSINAAVPLVLPDAPLEMRFNDGFWLFKSGVKPFHGLQVVQGLQEGDGYNFQVSTKPIRHRGDTLAGMHRPQRSGSSGTEKNATGPVLSVRVHTPTEGVIGVKIEHFKHIDPTPDIALFPDDPPVPSASLTRTDNSWTVSSGGLTADVNQNPYTITFRSPTRTLTAAGYKHQAIYDVPYKWTLRSASNNSCLATDVSSNPHSEAPPETVRYVHSELNISPGELIYGLGEQFGPFVKNGTRVWLRSTRFCSFAMTRATRSVC